jgi:hypothetical protein
MNAAITILSKYYDHCQVICAVIWKGFLTEYTYWYEKYVWKSLDWVSLIVIGRNEDSLVSGEVYLIFRRKLPTQLKVQIDNAFRKFCLYSVVLLKMIDAKTPAAHCRHCRATSKCMISKKTGRSRKSLNKLDFYCRNGSGKPHLNS